jgi:serine/threonine-protein kinase
VKSEGWDGPFRVVASAVVSVSQPQNRGGYEGRSHSLWFCDAQEDGRFAWYETAFMDGGFSSVMGQVAPYSLAPREASVALSNVMGTKQLAWPFEELDRADVSEFVDRWIGWFADASSGSLHYPSQMPEKQTSGSYRRS